VYLHTDASNYGIGSYLFQVIDSNEMPIAFMSKALNERECKWSTPGEENTIADGFSRLIDCNNNNSDEHIETLNTISQPSSEQFEQLNVLDSNKINKLPDSIYKIISSVHNSFAGHHGVERTLQKLLTSKNQWPQMREHIKQFIKKCPCCQKMSCLKIPIHTHPFTTASYEPMQRLNIDSMGPFDVDDNNNCHIIVIIDCFTRFVELYPVKDTTAYSAALALLNHMGRYGCASTILF
jgi:hypothetical protein